MNVVREDVDALNAIIKVVVSPEDYEGKVKETLNKYRKTAKIPGFRPGHVPMGLIEKQYGKSVLSEELNKSVSASLQGFISENKIEILGNPIPAEKDGFKGDFENPLNGDFRLASARSRQPQAGIHLLIGPRSPGRQQADHDPDLASQRPGAAQVDCRWLRIPRPGRNGAHPTLSYLGTGGSRHRVCSNLFGSGACP